MSKTTLKKLLAELDREQLTQVLLDLYDARKEAREYLEYFVDPDENAMMEKYRAVIAKEFFPAKGRIKGRTSVCKRAIKDFSLLHPSPRLIAELKMYLVESIVSYAVKMRSWIKESHENTLFAVFEEMLDYMFTHDLLVAFEPRIRQVLNTTKGLRGPVKSRTMEIFESFCESMKLRDMFLVPGISG